MDGGGFEFGEFPDDLPLPHDEGPAPLRGWVPPEDRLWRHPSELAADADPLGQSRRPGRRTMAMAMAGAVGVAAVATVAYAVSGGTPPRGGASPGFAASDTSLVTAPATTADTISGAAVPSGAAVASMGTAIGRTLVVVVVSDGSVTTRNTGVVLPGGNLVATAAAALDHASSARVVTADGRSIAADLAGSDDRAGVGVLRLHQSLSAAAFADEAVKAQQMAMTACMCSPVKTPRAAAAAVAVGLVSATGTAALVEGGPDLVDSIEAEAPLGSSYGSVLLDDNGSVIGVLDATRTSGNETVGWFVPSALVLGVSSELAQGHPVQRGWLGVVCDNKPAGGVLVTTVMSGSPAQSAGMHTGDVVEAVDAHEVDSLADLQARLYMSPPGTHLDLSVLRAGMVEEVPVVVGAQPA